jgi:hypothetical protein
VRSADGHIQLLGFGLEGLNGDPDWATDLAGVLQRLLQLDTGVEGPGAQPASPLLLGAWPNPFNPVLGLELELPAAGPVELSVYNLAGRRVATLHQGLLSAGHHRLDWQPGTGASGVYLVRLDTPWGQRSHKVIYLK